MRHLESIPADSRSPEKGSRLPRPAPASVEAPPARFPRSLPAFGTGSRFGSSKQARPGFPGAPEADPAKPRLECKREDQGN